MSSITLSFDNGPHPDVTPHVLEILGSYGIRATFFLVGQNVVKYAGLALPRQAQAEGHWIGNHTYSHSAPLGRVRGETAAIDEIRRTDRLLYESSAQRKLFRPYGEGGALDDRLLSWPAVRYLQAESYDCIIWNLIPRDWIDHDGWVDTACSSLRETPEALVVLHDTNLKAMARLSEFIERSLEDGHEFRQEFPESCVLMRNGSILKPIESFVAIGAEG